MREIKFRGKAIVGKRGVRTIEGKWVYGDLGHMNIDTLSKSMITCYLDDDLRHSFFIKEKTVGQYTGLKDKNGKEIYEGDIIANDSFKSMSAHIIGEVTYNCKTCCYEVCVSKEEEYLNISLSAAVRGILSAYVAGNIYDNPGLLKEGKE